MINSKLLFIKTKFNSNLLLLFVLSFLLFNQTIAQDNDKIIFYLSDNVEIANQDQIFISSNQSSDLQKIYVDANTIFYNSGLEISEVVYINKTPKNIPQKTKKRFDYNENKIEKKLKEKENSVICKNTNSDNFPLGRTKINVLVSSAHTSTASNFFKKISINSFNPINFEKITNIESNLKHDFHIYDKVINCFKINVQIYNRPPPQVI